ncbi:LysR family transcriptional regulator [Vibrio sp. S9_S30]|uniref:LysR family transcriptional regulator n=1 Tax=Vibrio sp. S9_S30 TaxID=2720226 RepID=UPI0016817620|nr:LysR family transcriptional regulator [Vibrio sp. S9_S30]MBD1557992.1 LysR family transcriptional regulator [Vibrio sp. S9_S30]
MKNHPSLSDIRTFVVLVEEGSFTKASERLMCSRSNVSKQLVQLETALGVTLLLRTTRTQCLTQQGEAFFHRCKDSLRAISHAIENVLESSDSLTGAIKINCVGGHLAEDIVALLINDFMTLYPDIYIELDFSSDRVNIISGKYDFIFRMGSLEDSSLIARKLTNITIGTYVSPEYLIKYGKPTLPSDLATHRCVSGTVNHWVFRHKVTKEKKEVQIKGHLACKNGRVMVRSACAGNGIIRVPECYCRQELEEGLLVALFEDWYIDSIPFYVLYARDKHQPIRLRTFSEFVVSNFQQYME